MVEVECMNDVELGNLENDGVDGVKVGWNV
jgi:hypothetical protein